MNKSFNEIYLNKKNALIDRNKVLEIINNELKRRSHPIIWKRNKLKILRNCFIV
jgi:hypothetical protein